MDCCRTSRRLGGVETTGRRASLASVLQGVAVGARGRGGREHPHRRESRAEAVRDRERQARRHGVRAARVDREGRQADEHGDRHRHPAVRRSHSRHRPGQRVPVDRARHRHHVRQVGHAGRRQDDDARCTRAGVFFGGDAAWGPQNIIWAVEHGHQAAISIHQHCQGRPVTERPPQGMHLESTKMGMHCVGVQQRLQSVAAREDAARGAGRALLEARTSRWSSASRPSRRRRKSSAASTATSRRTSSRSSASSATRASTCVR